nr:HNH endonuclease [Rothia nasimurium]
MDAAHLYSYADVGEHKDGGGLLMRSDVHRLYDKGLVAVTSKNRVALHEDLLKSQYAELQDQVLQVPVEREEKMLLAKHYEKHSTHLIAG